MMLVETVKAFDFETGRPGKEGPHLDLNIDSKIVRSPETTP